MFSIIFCLNINHATPSFSQLLKDSNVAPSRFRSGNFDKAQTGKLLGRNVRNVFSLSSIPLTGDCCGCSLPCFDRVLSMAFTDSAVDNGNGLVFLHSIASPMISHLKSKTAVLSCF